MTASLWTINTSVASSGGTRLDFGIPTIIGFAARFPELVRTYSSLTGMLSDGFLDTDLEYVAAAKIQAQIGQRTPTWIVGRRQSVPTISVVVTPTAVNSKIYRLLVNGTAASFTSDTTALASEITAGLKAAIDALAPADWVALTAYVVGDKVTNDTGKIYKCITSGTSAAAGGPTGVTSDITDGTVHWQMIGCNPLTTDGGTTLTIASPVAGQPLSVAIDDQPQYVGYAGLSLEYSHADPGIAADLTAIRAAGGGYGISVLAASTAEIQAASTWTESQIALLVQASPQTAIITTPSVNAAKTAFTYARTRTSIIYRADVREGYEFGLMTRKFAAPAGSGSFAYAVVVGSAADNLTDTHLTNLRTNNANFCLSQRGQNIFLDGKCASGDWLDVLRGRDWLDDELSAAMHDLQVASSNDLNTGKIPYTDAGISGIVAVVRGVLNQAVRRGFLEDGTVVVSSVLVASVPAATKAARNYPYVTWSAQLSGAIHGGTITGNITY